MSKISLLPDEAYQALEGMQLQAKVANDSLKKKELSLNRAELEKAHTLMEKHKEWVIRIVNAMKGETIPELTPEWLEKVFSEKYSTVLNSREYEQ